MGYKNYQKGGYRNQGGSQNHMPYGTVNNGKIWTRQGWQDYKKKSGAKEGRTKDDKIFVSAWNASKEKGMISISAFENRKSTESKSDRGNMFITMMFEIIYKRTGNKMLEVGNYNLTTGKVFLQKPGLVISTRAPNGGFCGKISSN